MTDHDTQEVSGCGECPYGDYEYDRCRHLRHDNPDLRIEDDPAYADAAPDWCPLRVRPVLVRLVVKEPK